MAVRNGNLMPMFVVLDAAIEEAIEIRELVEPDDLGLLDELCVGSLEQITLRLQIEGRQWRSTLTILSFMIKIIWRGIELPLAMVKNEVRCGSLE